MAVRSCRRTASAQPSRRALIWASSALVCSNMIGHPVAILGRTKAGKSNSAGYVRRLRFTAPAWRAQDRYYRRLSIRLSRQLYAMLSLSIRTTRRHSHSIILRLRNAMIQRYKSFTAAENRLLDPSEIRALDFAGEFPQFDGWSVSTTIGINRSICSGRRAACSRRAHRKKTVSPRSNEQSAANRVARSAFARIQGISPLNWNKWVRQIHRWRLYADSHRQLLRDGIGKSRLGSLLAVLGCNDYRWRLRYIGPRPAWPLSAEDRTGGLAVRPGDGRRRLLHGRNR